MMNLIKALGNSEELKRIDIEPLIISFLEEDNDPYAEVLKISYANGVPLSTPPFMILYDHGDPGKINKRIEMISEFNQEQQKRFEAALLRIKACAFLRGANTIFNSNALKKHYSWCLCDDWK